MHHLTRTIIKNVVVAITIGVAGIATWAATDARAPNLQASGSVARNA